MGEFDGLVEEEDVGEEEASALGLPPRKGMEGKRKEGKWIELEARVNMVKDPYSIYRH